MPLIAIPAHPKPFKYPKSLGACADMMHDIRETRLALDKLAEAWKAEETRIEDHLINTVDKQSSGAVGKRFIAQAKTKEIPQIIPDDFLKFCQWVAKTQAWECFQRRLSEGAVMERVQRNANGSVKKMPPGLRMHTAVKISLTKVK